MKDDSFSVDVIKRILLVLSTEGNMKKTVLAGRTGLNYSALIRYVKFLNTLKWVGFSGDPGTMISITPLGRSFREVIEGGEGPSEISEQVLGILPTKLHEGNLQSDRSKGRGKHETFFIKLDDDIRYCVLCGNPISNQPIAKEIDHIKYVFDKRQCVTLFMKLTSVYGRQFST